MNNFIEYDEKKKTPQLIKLDEHSVDDLEEYINDLSQEIRRAKEEIKKRLKSIEEAQKFFI